jgi:hypothetical protein
MLARSGIYFDGMDTDNYIQSLIPTINTVLRIDGNIHSVCDSIPFFENVGDVCMLVNKRHKVYKWL